jgi:hypothetical protein
MCRFFLCPLGFHVRLDGSRQFTDIVYGVEQVVLTAITYNRAASAQEFLPGNSERFPEALCFSPADLVRVLEWFASPEGGQRTWATNDCLKAPEILCLGPDYWFNTARLFTIQLHHQLT